MSISATSIDTIVHNFPVGGAGFVSPSSTQSPGRSQKLRILLVEDDVGDAYLIKQALVSNRRVKDVVIVEDGVEALELLDRGAVRPDLAFVDLHMPRKDGFALLRDMATRKGARIPSVVLTSSRLGADALRSRDSGAIGFVIKPISQAKLREALNREIARV